MFSRFRLTPEMRNIRNGAINFMTGVVVINLAYHLAMKGVDAVLSS